MTLLPATIASPRNVFTSHFCARLSPQQNLAVGTTTEANVVRFFFFFLNQLQMIWVQLNVLNITAMDACVC